MKIFKLLLVIGIISFFSFTLPKNVLKKVNKEIVKIKSEMENAIDKDYNFSVPLIVDANSAKNWNDAH